jgi:hypothetical protein
MNIIRLFQGVKYIYFLCSIFIKIVFIVKINESSARLYYYDVTIINIAVVQSSSVI